MKSRNAQYGQDLELALPHGREAASEILAIFLNAMDAEAKRLHCKPKRLIIAWDTGAGYSLERL